MIGLKRTLGTFTKLTGLPQAAGVWLLALGSISLAYLTVEPRYVYTADAMMRYVQATAVIATGSPRPVHSLADADPDFIYYPLKMPNYLARTPDGEWNAPFPVAYAYLGAALLLTMGREFAPLANGLLFMVYLLLLRHIWRLGKLALFFAILGTPLLMHAVDFSEIMLSLCLASAGLGLAVGRPGLSIPFRAAIGGALLGLSVAFRLELLLLVGAVGGFLLLQRASGHSKNASRDLIQFGAAAVVALLTMGLFHQVIVGNPLGAKLSVSTESEHEYEIYGQLRTAISLAIGTIKHGVWQPGFFGHSPVLLTVLAPLLLPRLRRRPFLRQTASVSTVYITLALGSAPHDGFWNWGARYLLPALPAALAAFGATLHLVRAVYRRNRRVNISRRAIVPAVLLGLIVCASIFSCWQLARGMSIYRSATQLMRQFDRVCAATEGDIALFDSEIAALHFGPCIFRYKFLLLTTPAETERLLAEIDSRFPSAVAVWFHAPGLDSPLDRENQKATADKVATIGDILESRLKLIDSKISEKPALEIRRYRIAAD